MLQRVSRTPTTTTMVSAIANPGCINAPHGLHSLLRCCQGSLLTLTRAHLVWWNVAEFILIHCVDDFHITRNFALDTNVGFTSHFSFFIKLLASLFDIVDRTSNNLDLLVLGEPLVHKSMLVTRG